MEDMAEAAIFDMELATPNDSPNSENKIEILVPDAIPFEENDAKTLEETTTSFTHYPQQESVVSLYDEDILNIKTSNESDTCHDSEKLSKNEPTSEIMASISLTNELKPKNNDDDDIFKCNDTLIKDDKDTGCDEIFIEDVKQTRCGEASLEKHKTRCNEVSVEDDKEARCNVVLIKDDKETRCNETSLEEHKEPECNEVSLEDDKKTRCSEVSVEDDKVKECDETTVKDYREKGVESDREEGELSPEPNSSKEQTALKTDGKNDVPETKDINFQSIEQYYDNLEKIYAEAKRVASELQEKFSNLMSQKQLQSIENRISAMKPVKHAIPNSPIGNKRKSNADSKARSHAHSGSDTRRRSLSYVRRSRERISKEQSSRRNYVGDSNGRRTPKRSEFDRRRSEGKKSPKRDSIERKNTTEDRKSRRSKRSCSTTRRRSSHSATERQTEIPKCKMSLNRERQQNYENKERLNHRISPRHSVQRRGDGHQPNSTRDSRQNSKQSKTKERKENQRVKNLVTRQMKMISDHIDNPKPIFERSTAHCNVDLKKTTTNAERDRSEYRSSMKDKPSTESLQSLEDLQNFLDVLKERNRGKISKDENTSSRLKKLKLDGEFGINAPQIIEQSRISIRASTPDMTSRQSSTNAKNKGLFFRSSKSDRNSRSRSLLPVQANADNGEQEVQNLPEYEMTRPLQFNSGDHGRRMGRKDEKEKNTCDRPPVKFEFKCNRNLKSSQIPQIFLNSDGYTIEQVPSNREPESSPRDTGHQDPKRETSSKHLHQEKTEIPKEKTRECHKSEIHSDAKKDKNRCNAPDMLKDSKAPESTKTKEQHTARKHDENEQLKLKKRRKQVDDNPSPSSEESESDTSHEDRLHMDRLNEGTKGKRKREVKTRKKIIILGSDKKQKFAISPNLLEMLVSKQLKHGILLKAKRGKRKEKLRRVTKNLVIPTASVQEDFRSTEPEWSLEKLEDFTEALRQKHGRNLNSLSDCDFAVKEDIQRESRFLDRHRAKRKAKLMACAFLASTNTSKEARLMESMKKTKTEDDLETEKVLKKLKAETDAVMSTKHEVRKQILGKLRKSASRRPSKRRSQGSNNDGVALQKQIYVSFPLKNDAQEQEKQEDAEDKTKAHLFSSKAQILLNSLRAMKKGKKPRQQQHNP